jgi:hypothetical protein
MYILLNCGTVSKEEWHPFTLTSAPEDNYVSVHIRCPDELDWCSTLRRTLVEKPAEEFSKGSVGPKTSASRIKVLYNPYTSEALFDALVDPTNTDSAALARPFKVQVFDKDTREPSASFQRSDDDGEGDLLSAKSTLSVGDTIKPRRPKDVIQMGIDGAHGAPSELVWRHRVVVLVGAGIGVTPFASILKSITRRMPTKAELIAGTARAQLTARGQLGSSRADGENQIEIEWKPCEHVHFYWLCRSQDEFEWFYDLLSRAVSQKTSGSQIEINLFKTSEQELATAKSIGSGFREFFGRPQWRRILPELAEKYPAEQVGVFFCGAPAIRGDLGTSCKWATSTNKFGTRFTLHAENF